ncbi:hypothetical protein H0E86_24060 [Streptomyces sp. SCSIO-PteL053]|nr:hypothetical protein H0E86_24060 [Streptomyces sp. SCSIO-PteL053]
MGDPQQVILEGIPVFTGDLYTKAAELTRDGVRIATSVGDIHSRFGGLQAFSKTLKVDHLFSTLKPVADRVAALKSDLATISGALGHYADDTWHEDSGLINPGYSAELSVLTSC